MPVGCPVCGGSTSEKFSVSAQRSAQHFVPKEGDKSTNAALAEHICNLWSGSDCQIRHCRGCGFGFAWPHISGDATFYNLAYPSVGYSKAKWEFSRTIEALRGVDLSDKTALEVGAGYGFFLDLLSKAGAEPSNLTAIEYNEGALKLLQQRGYRTKSNDVRSDDFAGQKAAYDFIFLFQVVEHMADLDTLFARLNFLLRRGGSVFIAVPNVLRTNYQEAHKSLLDMPPNHVSRWTVEAFRTIADRHGLALLGSETEPFDLRVFLPMDIRYSHLRRAQDSPRSLSGITRSMTRGRKRMLAEIATMLLSAPARLPHWIAAYNQRDKLGASLWVKLGKL